MHFLSALILCIISISTSISQEFTEYKWKNRLLLVVSKDMNSEKFQSQIAELKTNSSELHDRRLVVFKIIKSEKPSYTIKKDTTWLFLPELYNRYANQSNPFSVLLIGLDGQLKHKQTEVLAVEKLYTLIDAMPMRQAELGKNH